MVSRNRGHPQLVHDRLSLVEDVDSVRLVRRQLADEPLPFSGQRILPDQKRLRDGAAVDPVIDSDCVTGTHLEEKLF